MNKQELEKKLAQEGLLSVFDNGIKKEYMDGELVFCNDIAGNVIDAFGIYKSEDEEFVIFITDSERGVASYIRSFTSEEEACTALYEKVARLKRIHDKGMKER